MATGDSLVIFTPLDGTPPATVYATLDIMVGTSTPAESIPVHDFDDTTQEFMDFYGFMPRNYGGNGVTITFVHSAAAATGVFGIEAAFRRVADDAEDLDTTAQTYDYNVVAATVASAIGEAAYDVITFTNGADMDSVVAGDYFILRVRRNPAVGSDATGDCSIHMIEIKET